VPLSFKQLICRLSQQANRAPVAGFRASHNHLLRSAVIAACPSSQLDRISCRNKVNIFTSDGLKRMSNSLNKIGHRGGNDLVEAIKNQ
jgi:hypothetical protein